MQPKLVNVVIKQRFLYHTSFSISVGPLDMVHNKLTLSEDK
jgi:hypothetical protein